MDAKTKKKVAIGLGVVAVFMLLRARKSVIVLAQCFIPGTGNRTPWAGKFLGRGKELIGDAGCVLTSLTMAFNAFNNSNLTPDAANDIMVAAGAFAPGSSAMTVEDSSVAGRGGADALGMMAPVSERASGPAMRAAVNNALAKGGMVLLGVAGGQHTILLYGASGGGYVAADPAFGKIINLDGNFLATDNLHWASAPGHAPYQGVLARPLYNS